ncbi:Pyridine nucleotide-disulfide oxidoreductase family [Granulibacter bethesdensis]|uniref:Pyridine nucleotide-disulfide oxidoreductase family n=1 Tax=Granulibacter bethesdensis TaxID=364410 RepID=A0AAC9K6U4_9PROT|nr:FAD/NAD(P)-binding protein [Granulibacter bethesdensis]APH53890.1 Pyridine nucleotide-disulfide oxidoreductase family [Granulibacter bethesdensis]APH61468.1 Pyridine nucleotide-disulfide oxidoreductase family [Granulibacter bethesdensis]
MLVQPEPAKELQPIRDHGVCRHIALIGCGLSGAAFLAHLIRDHPDFSGRITVLEPSEKLGAGLAYGTSDPVHRTNVAAARMSLFPDLPDHFDEWLRQRNVPQSDAHSTMEDGRIYARRSVFGDYVDDTIRSMIEAASGRVIVRHLRLRAMSASRNQTGWGITLEDGSLIAADILVLGVSHTAPDLPAALRGLAGEKGLVADPWRPDALADVAPDAPVCIIGTGLTACDVIASLRARGHRAPMTALSRRGLLPRPRTLLPVEAAGDFSTEPARTASSLLRRIRSTIAAGEAQGRPWEDVIDALRVQAPVVWGALETAEKRRLLRHVRPFWDVHRFQCAPQIDAVVRQGLEEGWLTVRAASLVSAVSEKSGDIVITSRPRGQADISRLTVRAVVNCTGPGHRSVVEVHPVLHALAQQGALRSDPCRLGIDVDWESRVLDRDGTAWPDAFVVGPLARGTHGELMGLPQVTTQPKAVAATVAALAAKSVARDVPADAEA